MGKSLRSADLRQRYEWIRPLIEKAPSETKRPITIKDRALEVGVSPSTLSRLLQRYHQHGLEGLPDQRSTGKARKRRIPAPIQQFIVDTYHHHPHLKFRAIARQVKDKFDHPISHKSVKKALSQASLLQAVGSGKKSRPRPGRLLS
jgi:transposase